MFMQDDGSITSAATKNPAVGHVSWAPDYHGGAARPTTITFDELVPRYTPPPAANDNGGKPRVVGLMGYGGSGKSEVAKYLSGIGYLRTHIKAPLRNMAASLLADAGYSPAEIDCYLDGDLKRDTIPSIRRSGTEVQQYLGTEFGRNFCHPDLWLDLWCARAQALLGDGYRVVQESVRFPNEADAIRELGGVVVRVERPGVGPLSDHPSERPPCEPDFTIHNNGSITDLHLQVATWLRHAA